MVCARVFVYLCVCMGVLYLLLSAQDPPHLILCALFFSFFCFCCCICRPPLNRSRLGCSFFFFLMLEALVKNGGWKSRVGDGKLGFAGSLCPADPLWHDSCFSLALIHALSLSHLFLSSVFFFARLSLEQELSLLDSRVLVLFFVSLTHCIGGPPYQGSLDGLGSSSFFPFLLFVDFTTF